MRFLFFFLSIAVNFLFFLIRIAFLFLFFSSSPPPPQLAVNPYASPRATRLQTVELIARCFEYLFFFFLLLVFSSSVGWVDADAEVPRDCVELIVDLVTEFFLLFFCPFFLYFLQIVLDDDVEDYSNKPTVICSHRRAQLDHLELEDANATAGDCTSRAT